MLHSCHEAHAPRPPLARSVVQLSSHNRAVGDQPRVERFKLLQQVHGGRRVVIVTQQIGDDLALPSQIFLNERDVTLELLRLAEDRRAVHALKSSMLAR